MQLATYKFFALPQTALSAVRIKPRFIMIATAAMIAKLAILSMEFFCIDSAILMQDGAIMNKNAFQSVLIWIVF